MILGDSLQVMASLAKRERLRGKVQCIYVDPPYGIKFNSNFQWSTTSRDVKDGKADHITREPEQVKAFRDTWRDGIHSYLTYLRDRLTVARDLLTESGSVFVQIGDENVHRVRALMDEVFGEGNFCAEISFNKTGGFATALLASITDVLIWYAKNKSAVKYRPLFDMKVPARDAGQYDWGEFPNGVLRQLQTDELTNPSGLPEGTRVFAHQGMASQGVGSTLPSQIRLWSRLFTCPANSHWKTHNEGITRLYKASRLFSVGRAFRYKRMLSDFPVITRNNIWMDVGISGFGERKTYVVQTNAKVIERCILMTTDPGDLVLDPTCGSGTTAYVAEQWGRRWITIDTSRVALALARARVMGARYPYYLLADSSEGQRKEAELAGKAPADTPTHGNIRQGFIYERVPHVTLKSIANNTEIDVIWEKFQKTLEPLRDKLNTALKELWEEWEIPRAADDKWSAKAKTLHAEWWKQRITRQQEIDASIAAKADDEFLYDKPYEDSGKVRVAGPFTVESLSPHRVLGVDEDDKLIDGVADERLGYGKQQDFAAMILDNLRTAGVQQAHKDDKITFSTLTAWPGEYVCAEGRFDSGLWPATSDQKKKPQATDHRTLATEKRAAVFIGPEFGTVSRPDMVAAVREAAEAGFDVLIACAFNYDARASEFNKMGRIPILKARMNADLHMADDLKNTGKGNLFVIFGEPDISVTSCQWLVTSEGRMIANYEHVKELSGLGSLEAINRVGRECLSNLCSVSTGGEVRHDQSTSSGSDVGRGKRRGGIRTTRNEGVSPVSGDSQRLAGRDVNVSDSGAAPGNGDIRADGSPSETSEGRRTDAQRTQTLATLENLTERDFPLSLTTGHWSQVTVHGVDVFHPNTGEVRSDGPDGIACWFIDTDYNEESFFVRHAYFLGTTDPYQSLKTTLKAEINQEAWATLHGDTSRPFPKPPSGRIAVKVINHLGDEVMKVFRV